MTRVEQVKIESDENGFELHLIVDDDVTVDEDGRMMLNIHGVAEELYDAVKRGIGPWLYEMEMAKARYSAGVRDAGLTAAEREEEERCAALGLEGPNVKIWRWERAQ